MTSLIFLQTVMFIHKTRRRPSKRIAFCLLFFQVGRHTTEMVTKVDLSLSHTMLVVRTKRVHKPIKHGVVGGLLTL